MNTKPISILANVYDITTAQLAADMTGSDDSALATAASALYEDGRKLDRQLETIQDHARDNQRSAGRVLDALEQGELPGRVTGAAWDIEAETTALYEAIYQVKPLVMIYQKLHDAAQH